MYALDVVAGDEQHFVAVGSIADGPDDVVGVRSAVHRRSQALFLLCSLPSPCSNILLSPRALCYA